MNIHANYLRYSIYSSQSSVKPHSLALPPYMYTLPSLRSHLQSTVHSVSKIPPTYPPSRQVYTSVAQIHAETLIHPLSLTSHQTTHQTNQGQKQQQQKKKEQGAIISANSHGPPSQSEREPVTEPRIAFWRPLPSGRRQTRPNEPTKS